MISPQELKKRSFSKSFSGYSASEVDEYIAYLTSLYNEVYAENVELQQKLVITNEKLNAAKSDESAISATILNAQKMADAIIGDAKEKAAELIDNATIRSDEITSSISDSCERIINAYMTRVTVERDRLEKLESAVSNFKDSLYNAYKEHISLIDSIMPEDNTTPYLSDEELENKALEIAEDSMRRNELEKDALPDFTRDDKIRENADVVSESEEVQTEENQD